MKLKEFKKYWNEVAKEEVKEYDKTEEHDLDFAISYKEVAYSNYKKLIEDLKKVE